MYVGRQVGIVVYIVYSVQFIILLEGGVWCWWLLWFIVVVFYGYTFLSPKIWIQIKTSSPKIPQRVRRDANTSLMVPQYAQSTDTKKAYQRIKMKSGPPRNSVWYYFPFPSAPLDDTIAQSRLLPLLPCCSVVSCGFVFSSTRRIPKKSRGFS